MGFLSSGIQNIDNLLKGGVETGSISLFYGEAGSGKTNFCLQFSLNAIKKGFKTIYISSFNFPVERMKQIFKNDYLMENILILNSFSNEKHIENINKSMKRINLDKDIKLLVIDSFTDFYNLEKNNHHQRKVIIDLMDSLHELSEKKDISIIITSQVYEDIVFKDLNAIGLGITFYRSKTIVQFSKDGELRKATIIKHKLVPEGKNTKYFIKEEGIFS